MLNKPKFLSPSTNMRECVIDAVINDDNSFSNHLPFSCIIDGNEAVVAWQIKIYRLKDNLLVYETEKVDLSQTPFFPIDEKNRNVIFTIDLKEYPTLETHLTTDENSNYITLTNSDEPYYWTIQVWGTSGVTSTSCEEVFYANATPTIEIKYSQDNESFSELTDGTVLNSRTAYFKATYSGTESPLKRYGWRLTDSDSGQVLLDTISHNQIYGTADNIICTYDGFLDNGNYSIELYVETQNGVLITKDSISFSASYGITFLLDDFKAEPLKNEPAIMLDWSKSNIISGREIGGEVSFKENYPIVKYSIDSETQETIAAGTTSVSIPDGVSIVYDYGSSSSLNISEDSYIVLSTQLLNCEDTTLFMAEGIDSDGCDLLRKLTFSTYEDENGDIKGKFIYNISSGDTSVKFEKDVTNLPNQYVWYIITMSPLLADGNIDLIVTESCATGGLVPSGTLYPYGDLYPYFGEWDKLKITEGETE